MQKSDSDPANFVEGNNEHEDFLESLVEIINNNLLTPINCPIFNSNGQCVCDENYCTAIGGSTDCCVSNSKLQFHLEEPSYYQDPLAWDCSGPGGFLGGCAGHPYCWYLPNNYLTDENCILNVFFFERSATDPSTTTGGCGPGYFGEATNWAYMVNIFDFYTENTTGQSLATKKQRIATLLLHELSHSLGLGHTNWQNQAPDLPTFNENQNFCNPLTDANCSNNVMTEVGRTFQNWLTPHQIANMHRLLIGSFRAKQLLVEYDESKNVTINQDETWDIGRVVYGDVYVESGNRLTITCKTIMAPGGKIYVKPGAELVVDGGLITIASNECGGYWDGIHALGYSDKSQQANQGVLEQALVEVINGGIIEYANVGIRTVDIYTFEEGGGAVINCIDANFRNNNTSTLFGPYPNAALSNPSPNISYFENCNFAINEDYTGTGFSEHVYLQEVDGLDFKGCDFSNTDYSTTHRARGIGIKAIDAHFEVESDCPTTEPSCDDGRSSFHGFFRGIDVSMSGSFLYTYLVDRAVFSKNTIGIYNRAVNNPVITRCDMDLSLSSFFTNERALGIYIHGGTGYTIEENEFDNISSTNHPVGVLVRDTKDGANQIRRNFYNNLHVGNLSNDENLNPVNPALGGLRYFCNTNSNNTFDFAVPLQAFYPGIYGIAANQGTLSEGAGNMFSLNGNNSESDFKNENTYGVNYYSHLSVPSPVSISPSVLVFEADDANTCDINFPGIVGPGPGEVSTAKSIHLGSNQQRSLLLQIQSNNMDGGDQNALTIQIQNSTAQNKTQLKNHLLSVSPWLSTKTLKDVARRSDVFSHSDVFDIMTANPDEIRSESLLNFLATTSSPMPDNMIESLRNLPFQSTSRTELESSIGMWSSKLHSAASLVTHFYLTDSLNNNPDSVRVWLSRQENISTDMAIVESWLHEKNISEANQYLNNLPQLHEMSATQQLEYAYFRNLKNIQINLISEGRCAAELTPDEMQEVTNIADNGQGIAQLQAQNILNTYYDGVYYDEPILPAELGGFREGGQVAEAPRQISAFPNPADDIVHFRYQLDKEYNDMSIRIMGVNGDLIKEIALPETQEGYISWNTEDLISGFYFYSINSNRHPLAVGKLIISK